MTDEVLFKKLLDCIQQGNCFNGGTRDILMAYKEQGGKQENAWKIVEQLAADFADDEYLQDRAYDILDIITGWCDANFLVWDRTGSP